jgi:hypothetical protein
MVLVDASVWVSRLRETHAGLVDLPNDGEIGHHPFIVGELACGNLKNRTTMLALPAGHEEVLAFMEGHDLMGKRLGYIDVHLLASAVLTELPIRTFDKKPEQIADMLCRRHQQKSKKYIGPAKP